jgi:hypothetical protein
LLRRERLERPHGERFGPLGLERLDRLVHLLAALFDAGAREPHLLLRLRQFLLALRELGDDRLLLRVGGGQLLPHELLSSDGGGHILLWDGLASLQLSELRA